MPQRRSTPPHVSLDPVHSGASTPLNGGPGEGANNSGTSAGVRQAPKRAGTVEALLKTTLPPSPPRTSPTSAAVPPRRSSGPRLSQFENSFSSSPIGKVKMSEPRIVRPISLLVVEGLYSLCSSVIKSEGFADNSISQTLLYTFMRKKKIKYDVAKNGEKAVEKWRSGRFYLILVGSALHPKSTFSRMNSLLDGYSNANARDGRHLRDQGDPSIEEAE